MAATSVRGAELFAVEQGIEPTLTLTRADLLTRPAELRERVQRAGLDAVMVHSADWRRERSPQLYELALALMPVRERLIADEAAGVVHRLSRAVLGARVARLPAQIAEAGGAITTEALRFALGRSRGANRPLSQVSSGSASVLAIWPGSSETVGGAISHITGILTAFRHAGFRVGLVTTAPPPEQVRAAVDDIEVIPCLSAAARMTGDTTQIISNAPVRKAAIELARRLNPSFIYQRHCAFLVAGADLSRLWRIPLVLEWNGSEVWARDNWTRRLAVERLLDPLAVAAERAALTSATLIAAVSHEAAEMAVHAGASRNKTLVLPNAVDLQYVDVTVNGSAMTSVQGSSAVLGWAGSFGPWHGGEVVVRVLAQLPPTVRLLMIGDGAERATCRALATSLGLADRIEWTGAIPHREALRRLSACDVLVSPQTPLPGQSYFQSPIKIFEYMALGRPIVASRLGQMGDLLTDRLTARLVAPGDAQELSEAILEVLESADQGRALGEAARREVEARHTWDHRAQTVLERLEC